MDLVYENKVFQVIENIDCLNIIGSRHHMYSLKYVWFYLPQIQKIEKYILNVENIIWQKSEPDWQNLK